TYSAVLDAARVAARDLDTPVEFVDTATVSFPVALCVAAAADTRQQGGDVQAVAASARAIAALVDSIFVVGVPALALRGGRLGAVAVPNPATILTLGPSGLAEQGAASDIDDAIARMAAHVRQVCDGRPFRVGVGDADRPDLGDQLADALDGTPGMTELTRYEVGPSVGAHSGPGTVGAVWAPITQSRST
ncbi:MAG: DegV family protein, partial [Pseudonocardiales bacterium]|nr:DegV family protein [Pseudonocardiales bacterium]